MPIAVGTRLGPYQVVAPLGAGGMGEVYKARDTRLDRTVAIKVLPSSLALDPVFRERFDREAKTISALDHPNICALYDVGDHAGISFLVMQYLEGETLASRLTHGPLPLRDALRIANEIASALDRAHRQGVVHRDLKPGNIMLTKTGTRLLDFGLAKTTSRNVLGLGGPDASTAAPGAPVTAEGTILGTLQYMSPEQLEGHPSDVRSDIWAFGCILHEMIAGRRPFEGTSQASVVGAILRDEPRSLALDQPLAPAVLDHLVRTCLAKDPDERWQNAGDIKRELSWIASGRDEDSAGRERAGTSEKRMRLVMWSAVATAVVILTAASLYVWRAGRAPAANPSLVRFSVLPPPNTTLVASGATVPSAQLALSPDGRRFAFVATPTGGGHSAVWMQNLDALQAQMVPGTDDATNPFWSPDGKSIAFFAQGKLKRIDASGGPAQSICEASTDNRGGTWNQDGTIVFAPSTATGLFQVSATGGTTSLIVPLDHGDSSYRWPSFLPDGRHFLFFVRGTPDRRGLYVGSLDGKVSPRVLETPLSGMYAPPGYILTARDGTLFAYPFDTVAQKITGEGIVVAQDVGGSSTQLAGFSVSSSSSSGVLAHARGLTTLTRLTWFDRSGKPAEAVTDVGDYVSYRLSPDGRRLAFSRVDPVTNTTDVWLVDLPSGLPTRFTSDPASDTSPIWSPDGSRLVFRSDRAGNNTIFEKPISAVASEKQMTNEQVAFPTDWSLDGKFILYHTPFAASGMSFDVLLLPLAGEKRPVPFAETRFTEIDAQFSADGKWIAYASDESGQLEVYVQSFPQTGAPRRVSTGGGSEPRWRRDGREQELFYLAPDGTLMAVSVKLSPSLELGTPRALFQMHTAFVGSSYRMNYDVSGDGQRFLVNAMSDRAATSPITVVLNWTSGLRK